MEGDPKRLSCQLPALCPRGFLLFYLGRFSKNAAVRTSMLLPTMPCIIHRPQISALIQINWNGRLRGRLHVCEIYGEKHLLHEAKGFCSLLRIWSCKKKEAPASQRRPKLIIKKKKNSHVMDQRTRSQLEALFLVSAVITASITPKEDCWTASTLKAETGRAAAKRRL